MPKLPKTCISCASKKRKCDRKRPCSRCAKANISCEYPGDPVIKQLQALQITPANESVFGNPIAQLAENWSTLETEQSVLTGNTNEFDSELIRIQNNMLEAMEMMLKVSKGFLRRCCTSFLMRLSIVAFYYVLNGDVVNKQIWLEKCVREFSVQLRYTSLPNLLGAIVLALCYIKSGDFKVGIPYFSFVINSAKMLGINKETGLATLTKDPQEKEDCRNIWWAIYRVDQFMALIGKGLLMEEDNGIYLPGAANYIQSDDDIRSLGLEVMASRKWFTPIVYSANIYVNKVLLDRLLGQAIKAHAKYKSDQSIDTIFALANLSDSLILWHSNLPKCFANELELMRGMGKIESNITWIILDAYLQFNFSMVIVNCPLIYYNLTRDYQSAIQSRAFSNLYKDSKLIADIFHFFILKNPTLEYTTLFYINYAFQALIPMTLCKSVNETNILLQGMEMLIKKFRIGHSVYTLARRLLDLDEIDILQEYSRFSFVDNLQIADGDKVLREFLNDDIEMNQ